MEIKNGTKLTVTCSRKGTFNARATETFDPANTDFAPIILDQQEPVHGKSSVWEKGDPIPVRCSSATFTIRK